MAVVDPRFTYSDLQTTPDDGKRYEILEGDMLVSPSPKPRHQEVVTKLVLFLGALQRSGSGKVYAAPLDVYIDEHTVLEPDVLFVKSDRLGIVLDRYVAGPPDLVIEVLSESSRDADFGRKLRTYARFGVPEYWVADPDERTAQVFRLKDGTYGVPVLLKEDTTLVYRDARIPVRELFS